MTPTKWMMACLRVLFAFIFALAWVTLIPSHAQDKKPPESLEFESKMGNVTFDHVKHTERVQDDCTACHEKLFPQSKAPLNYKEKMHQVAEANKTSCGSCHHEGGAAFAAKGKCNTCHVKN